MRDLNDLNFFVAVVANGGISAASRALSLPKSRVSRRVAALEAELGVRLIERSTRRFKVTEVGQDVYRHAQAALSEAEAVHEVISRRLGEPQGLVRVSCPAAVDRLLASFLPELMAAHPKLRLQLVVTNRRVDLIEEGVDVALRFSEHLDADADLQVKVVGRTGALLVASPAFVTAHGQPSVPAELSTYPTLSFTDRTGMDRWVLVNAAGGRAEVVHEPRISASAFTVLSRAAIHGLGIALLPEHACCAPLQTGELVRILPDWQLPQGLLHLVFTSRRGLLPGVRATIDFLSSVLCPSSPAWRTEDAVRL